MPVDYMEWRSLDKSIDWIEVIGESTPLPTTYTVRKDGSKIAVLIDDSPIDVSAYGPPAGFSEDWKTYGPFCQASFTAELHDYPASWIPGTATAPVRFENMQVRLKNSSICTDPLAAFPYGYCVFDATQEPQLDRSGFRVMGASAFEIWDSRSQ